MLWTAPRFADPAYLTEWDSFRAAVQARVPEARFAGPNVASDTAWVGALAEKAPDGLVLLTRHCYADGPAGAPQVSLGKLLSADQQIAAPSTASKAEMLIASRRCPLSTP
jgi:hypothetical protein